MMALEQVLLYRNELSEVRSVMVLELGLASSSLAPAIVEAFA